MANDTLQHVAAAIVAVIAGWWVAVQLRHTPKYRQFRGYGVGIIIILLALTVVILFLLS